MAPSRVSRLSLSLLACAAAAPSAASAAVIPKGPDAGVFSLSCEGADLFPNATNRTTARLATACLINEVRRVAGLHRLETVRELRRIAAAHSRDMVLRRYFAHTEPPRRTLAARLRSIDWSGAAGENIAWGTTYYATPRAIVWAWMRSPGHRANILFPGYRSVGVALSLGVPKGGSLPGSTYTADFGAGAGAGG